MAQTPPPELQPASENAWYKLATVAGNNYAENTRRWNGYMRYLIGEEEAANLKQADGTSKLPRLSSAEEDWITRNIPVLPQGLPKAISLSGLLFAEAVNFQDFYFPVSVFFAGSSFTGYAGFEESTFAGTADFTKSTFAGTASFEKSTFAKLAIFAGSSFTGYAGFEKSTFAGTASFEESTFTKAAFFEESTFAGAADFKKSTFAGDADFKKSTFAGPAYFGKSKYENKTSFQNVTFKVAPLFFETTLHEDTDWTGITWPAKPANKEDATEYVRRYDRLALMMSTLKQPDNEHQFFRLSMRAKEVRDGWGISTGLSRLYGLFFGYGWGLKRALGLWVANLVLGAGYLWVMALCQMSQPLPCLKAVAISFSNSLPFLGLQRGPVENAYNAFHTLSGFNMLWTIQSLSGTLLLFFLAADHPQPLPPPVARPRPGLQAKGWPLTPGSVQPHPSAPVPGRHKLSRPKPGLSRLGLVFLRHIRGRIAPIGQRVPLTNQPAVQVRAVRSVANTERPHVAVPALYRAGDRARHDPRPERLQWRVPHTGSGGWLPAGKIAQIRGRQYLGAAPSAPPLQASSHRRSGAHCPGSQRGLWGGGPPPPGAGERTVARSGGRGMVAFPDDNAVPLRPDPTCHNLSGNSGSHPLPSVAGMGKRGSGREYHDRQEQLDTPAKQMIATVHFILLWIYE